VSASSHPFPRLRWLAPLWLAVYLPAYALAYGWVNFLFLCNVGVVLTALGLWLGHRLLLSAAAVGALFVGFVWVLDSGGRLLLGEHPLGVTAYMWDPQFPLFTRLLSLYHVGWPLLLLALLAKIGYDRRGWALQGALALPLVVAGRFLGTPEENINYAFTDPIWGVQLGPPAVHLATIAAATIALVFGLSHRLLVALRGGVPDTLSPRPGSRRRRSRSRAARARLYPRARFAAESGHDFREVVLSGGDHPGSRPGVGLSGGGRAGRGVAQDPARRHPRGAGGALPRRLPAAGRSCYALNPRITDPHWIYPGRRVRIPLVQPAPQPNAQVVVVSNRVEARPTPVEWLSADSGDLLLERDGLRTYASSSARLRFDDGSTATVSEDSLVFIRRQTPALAPAPRREIEIEIGQAEIETVAGARIQPEIEVLVGGARSTTRAGESGAHSRHRREGEGAQVMLYRGRGEVVAGGGSVALAEGTGTSVAPGAMPRPPERLLPAPELVAPADGLEMPAGGGGVELSWRPVAGAASYVVELCADRSCAALVRRVKDLRTTSHRLTGGLRRQLYWRVTAVGASGLDGYPSPARTLRPELLVVFD
jgi:hypothetical protein